MCMVSVCPPSVFGLCLECDGLCRGWSYVNKQGSALVHMHLIKLFAKDTILDIVSLLVFHLRGEISEK